MAAYFKALMIFAFSLLFLCLGVSALLPISKARALDQWQLEQLQRQKQQQHSVQTRQDRLPVWSLSYLTIGIIGLGFLFTFFDIGDSNVSAVCQKLCK